MSDPLAALSSAPPRRQNQSIPATGPATGADSSLSRRWTSLFIGSITPSIDALKTRAIEGVIAREDAPSLRWIQWKLFLTEHISSIPSSWSAVLERDRDAYNELRCRLLRAPDGNYPPEVGFNGDHTTLDSSVTTSPRRSPHAGQARSAVVNDLSVNNPLSLDDLNPWKTYYTTLETRRLILQDVERTFPDLALFRHTNVQQSLTNILFLWTLQNEDVGYRQGMHELAAVLWKVRSDGAVDYQRASASNSAFVDAPFHQALADVFIEHDVYTLFCVLMQSAKDWYAWQTPAKATSTPITRTSSSSMFVRSPTNPRRSEDAAPQKLPIVLKCEHIMEMLRYIDPALAQHLESLGIEPQIFCLRWIRMIFTREFALDNALAIWDGLFASGGSLSLIDDVCIAMLLRIRNQLLSGDHTSALQCLLRYPQEAQVQPNLLIKQAIYLRDNSRQPATGVAVVMQNRDLLGIAVRSTNDSSQEASLGQSDSSSPSQRPSTQKFATVGRMSSGAATRPSPWDRLRDDSFSRNAGSQPARSEIRCSRPAVPAGDPLGALQEPASSVDANGPRPFAINPSAYLPEGISDMAKGWYERAELPQTLNSALANVSRTVAAAASAYASNKPETSGFPSGFEQAFNSQTGPRSTGVPSTVGHVASSRKARPSLSGSGGAETTDAPQPPQPTSTPSKKSYEDLADQLAKLTTANKAIGSALSVCIGVLEQSWLDQTRDTDAHRTQELEQSSLNTLMSFTALKHIRDVLDGTATEFDPATLPTLASTPNAPATSAEARHAVMKQDTRSAFPPEQIVELGTKAKETAAKHNGGSRPHPSLPMSLAEYARYGRQMILPDFGLPGQLRLRRAKVLVVGAGGLGCPAVQYLAAAGVGEISILDHDVVEPSNLARQILHSDATVGVHKAVSAANAAKQINPYIKAVPISEAINAANARQMMRGQDLVLDCTDNPLTRYLISDAAVLEGVQVVSGAAQGYDSQLVVLHKRIKPEFAGPKGAAVATDGLVRGPCYRCLFPKAPRPDEVTNCEDGGVLGGITGLVGTMQALESVKILAGIGEDTPPMLTLVSPLTSSPFRSVKIRPRRIATCRSCGDPAQVAEPMITDLEKEDYVSFCGLNAPPDTDGGLPRTAARAMDSKALVVDVRPPIEYGITKLDGSLNLPIQTVLKNPQVAWKTITEATEKTASSSVLVVCKRGNDSRLAVKALLEQQQKEAQETEDKPVQKVSAHPLEAPADSKPQPAKSRNKSVPVSDLIGGLRAYAKEKDPTFPIY